MTTKPVADPGWLCFDLHGRARMGVARNAPTAAQLCTMFGNFLTEDDDGPFDLTVTGDMQQVNGAAYAEDTFSYTPNSICLCTPVQVPVAYDADRASGVIADQLASGTTALGVSAESGS